jgi:hypothetical protein
VCGKQQFLSSGLFAAGAQGGASLSGIARLLWWPRPSACAERFRLAELWLSLQRRETCSSSILPAAHM